MCVIFIEMMNPFQYILFALTVWNIFRKQKWQNNYTHNKGEFDLRQFPKNIFKSQPNLQTLNFSDNVLASTNIFRKHFQKSSHSADVGSQRKPLNRIAGKYFQTSNQFADVKSRQERAYSIIRRYFIKANIESRLGWVNNITRKNIQESNEFADVESHREQLNNIIRKYFRRSNQFAEVVSQPEQFTVYEH